MATVSSPKTKVERVQMESSDSVAKFWKELDGSRDEADFIQEQTQANPSLLFSKSDDGCSLTEFLCGLDRSANVRDVLDELIKKKVPVTDECYSLILSAHDCDHISPDMLKSLLQSGYLPKEIDGQKPLDAIFEELENGNDWFEEEPEEFIRDAFGIDENAVTGPCKIEVGVTHEAGGCFEKWFHEAGGVEESKLVNDKKRKQPSS